MAVLELTAEQVYRLASQLTPEQKRELVSKLTTEAVPRRLPRVPGHDKGKVWVAPDFNAPLPADLEDLFYP